jgi:hypothetical protein
MILGVSASVCAKLAINAIMWYNIYDETLKQVGGFEMVVSRSVRIRLTKALPNVVSGIEVGEKNYMRYLSP